MTEAEVSAAIQRVIHGVTTPKEETMLAWRIYLLRKHLGQT